MRKNLLLTFFFSLCPGAGQMYQGYMKRGLSLMTIAAAIVLITAFVSSPILLAPLLVLFAYSFFDTFCLRNMKDSERENYTDEYVWTDSQIVKSLREKGIFNNKYVGWGLILLGIYLLVVKLLVTIDTKITYDIACFIERYAPTVAVAVISILIGKKMIKD